MKSHNCHWLGLALSGSAFLMTAGQVRAQLAPPAGNTLFLSVFGAGFQDYQSAPDPNNAGAFVWNFIAPDAPILL